MGGSAAHVAGAQAASAATITTPAASFFIEVSPLFRELLASDWPLPLRRGLMWNKLGVGICYAKRMRNGVTRNRPIPERSSAGIECKSVALDRSGPFEPGNGYVSLPLGQRRGNALWRRALP